MRSLLTLVILILISGCGEKSFYNRQQISLTSSLTERCIIDASKNIDDIDEFITPEEHQMLKPIYIFRRGNIEVSALEETSPSHVVNVSYMYMEYVPTSKSRLNKSEILLTEVVSQLKISCKHLITNQITQEQKPSLLRYYGFVSGI